jgi:hypothetical protein
LGVNLTPSNAIRLTRNGAKTISVVNVSKGILEEAYTALQLNGNLYARSIEGFEYSIEVWSTANQAYSSIGKKPPEQLSE